MTRRSVVLLGGPDSGKTNFIGRLWSALDARKGALVAVEQPDDIRFVLDTADHLFQGHFAPRTQLQDGRRDFEVTVAPPSGDAQADIVIPDVHGELWREAVVSSEIPVEWMKELQSADGALLFVRVGSDLNVRPLDWVVSRALLQKVGKPEDQTKLPTQVMLCELVRFLERSLKKRPDGTNPRLSLVVAAWDAVDADKFAQGPVAYIKREYPMLAGKLADTQTLDTKVFGLSIVGGDLTADDSFRAEYLEAGMDGHGWVAAKDANGEWQKNPDLTLPIAWVVGF
jgi:hypothetical protein